MHSTTSRPNLVAVLAVSFAAFFGGAVLYWNAVRVRREVPAVDAGNEAGWVTLEPLLSVSGTLTPLRTAPTSALPSPTTKGTTATSSWDGKQTFMCSGEDDLALDGVTVTLPGKTLLMTAGRCKLRVSNCTLRGHTVLFASGASQVTFDHCILDGSDTAITAFGTSHVNVRGSTMTGRVSALGGAVVDR